MQCGGISHRLTGASKSNIALRNKKGQTLLLWGDKEPAYELYNQQQQEYPFILWRECQLPITCVISNHREEAVTEILRSEEEALAEAISRGKMAAYKKIPAQAEVVEEYVRVMTRGPELYQVHVTVEVREDIGVFVPLPVEDQKQLEFGETEERKNGATE